MRILTIRAALLAMAAASAPAFAAPSGCMADATTQTAIDDCAASRYRQSDLQLNHTYQALVAKVAEPARGRLKEAQRHWVAWRDAQCAFEASGVAGGSAAPIVASQCLDALTRAQTRRLDSHLHCPEGDLACTN
ncbi:lysozyme inhibitor LprI family protein [Burkholderia plantarii]|uniref:lysozyme inhibitor LprI family protein n=1 Tax=Burkholderia plantarii TaxID=41899 RepID=UPI0006D8AD53|nr:lysozyme inhibitor LprI family protein [Burkholderia plantarii]ALK33506.1 hypothetical protein bpln_2g12660 [Burkholderia plantarii]GLZ16681.1 hypothetical protein Bpla01_02110 [Burkholderia plantarii]